MERNQSTIKRRSDKLTSMKSHPNVIEVASKLAVLLDSVKCSICLDVMIQPARIKCGHTFCTLCIENAIQFNKAGEGTLLRKISGGSAKADCPLCKKSNITKRGITADPVLENKIKILKDLQNNIRGAAKELGFELDSVRNGIHKNGTIEARSGLTPMKNPSNKNEKTSKAITNTARIFDTQTPTFWGEVTASAPKMKTYSTGKKKVPVYESKIARHFNKPGPVVLSKKAEASVYDELTDESPPRKLQKTCDTTNAFAAENIQVDFSSSLYLQPECKLPSKALKRVVSANGSKKVNSNFKTNKINPKQQTLNISSGKDDTPASLSSSLSLHSLRKDSMPHLPKLTQESENESIAKENIEPNTSSSLPLHSALTSPTTTSKHVSENDRKMLNSKFNMDKILPKHYSPLSGMKYDTPGSTSSSLSLHSLNKDSIPHNLQKLTQESEDESESQNINLSPETKPMYADKLSKTTHKQRNISFTIKGKTWANSRFDSDKKRPKNVVFAKMGNIAPKEKLYITVANMSSNNVGLILEGNLLNKIDQDPNKSGIVLETETSTSMTQNSEISVNHQSLLSDNNYGKPVVNGFDINEEKELISFHKRGNALNTTAKNIPKGKYLEDRLESVKNNQTEAAKDDKSQPEFCNQDSDHEDPFSVEESDEDLFEATPDDSIFKPKNTSTTKRNKRMLSQSPVVKAPNWKDVVKMSGAGNLFENFEIALHGDFGLGIKGGELFPSKMELWQLLTGCGATVYKSVNLFTFARGITGLCVVNNSKGNGLSKTSTTRSNEYSSIFACSDVAVVEKQWLLECLTKEKLVSIMPFLQHNAKKENLIRLDYGNHLL